MSRPTEPLICANALTNSSLLRLSLVNQSGMMDPNWASISMPFTQPEMSSWGVIASNHVFVSAFAMLVESYRRSPCTKSRWSSGSVRRAEVMARAAFGKAITLMPSMGSHVIPPASRSLQRPELLQAFGFPDEVHALVEDRRLQDDAAVEHKVDGVHGPDVRLERLVVECARQELGEDVLWAHQQHRVRAERGDGVFDGRRVSDVAEAEASIESRWWCGCWCARRHFARWLLSD